MFGRPHGVGRMFKENGELYLGHFNNGKSQGQGVYLFKDGSYYKGNFDNNVAKDKNGAYHSKTMVYNDPMSFIVFIKTTTTNNDTTIKNR